MIMKEWLSKIGKKGKGTDKDKQEAPTSQVATCQFTDNINVNLECVKQEIGHNWDVHFREFNLGRTGIRSVIIFVDGLSDKDLIDKHIMSSLMVDFSAEYKQNVSNLKGSISKEFLKNEVLSISEIEAVCSIKELASKVLTGSTALLIDGSLDALILGTTKLKTRTIEEPVSEALVRGPRVGFTESLSDNTSFLRCSGEIRNLSLGGIPSRKVFKKRFGSRLH